MALHHLRLEWHRFPLLSLVSETDQDEQGIADTNASEKQGSRIHTGSPSETHVSHSQSTACDARDDWYRRAVAIGGVVQALCQMHRSVWKRQRSSEGVREPSGTPCVGSTATDDARDPVRIDRARQ